MYKNFSKVSPGTLFSIWNLLIDPSWAVYQLLEPKTLTSKSSVGFLFSTDHRVSPFTTKENRCLPSFFSWLISITFHTLRRGIPVSSNLTTAGLPSSDWLMYSWLPLKIHNAGVRSPTLPRVPPLPSIVMCRICLRLGSPDEKLLGLNSKMTLHSLAR